MIQTLENIIITLCCYGLELKDSDGFTHDWCTLIPALELEYITSIHSTTGKTTAMFKKGWNPRLPFHTLKKSLVDIYPTESSLKIMLDKERHHTNGCMQDFFKYTKQRGYKIHEPPYFKVGELVLVSNLKFNYIKGPKKLKH
ncbi:hypothetical protein O181_010518 [Austropuccinia psidii MF-1]|uniref:Uncharacterized protein n=1 Tax=Austropuccinia psidii MF-1 TaxID=1389203 RepID=A0A9Q3BTH4_9BASI|nr:hypothetical protein [Austropuccinia psidii MF-1]